MKNALNHLVELSSNFAEAIRSGVEFVGRVVSVPSQNAPAIDMVHMSIGTSELGNRLVVHIYQLVDHLLTRREWACRFSLKCGQQPRANKFPIRRNGYYCTAVRYCV